MYATFYFFCLMYCFLGVKIAADIFMSAIELITSQRIRVRSSVDSSREVTVKVWNDTVANLTLLALGSSAPEIMLAVVETVGNDFHAGDLGPSTIVGSAAFNLLVIVAVCILSVPSPQLRLIKDTGVYHCTILFQSFAYIWLYIIVSVISPEIIDIWEAVFTWAMMPVLVIVCFLVDKNGTCCEGTSADTAKSSDHHSLDDSKHGLTKAEQYTSKRTWTGPRVSTVLKRRETAERKLLDRLESKQDATAMQDANLYPSSSATSQSPDLCVMDSMGQPLVSESGVLSFENDVMMVGAGSETIQVQVPVHRRNTWHGPVTCKYKTMAFGSVPGFDYLHREGNLIFDEGESRALIDLTVLPKRVGERDGCFQLVLEEISEGGMFNPSHDGGEESEVLTVYLVNEQAPSKGREMIDWDRIYMISYQWLDQIKDAVFCAEEEDEDEASEEEDCILLEQSPSFLLNFYSKAFVVAEYPWRVAMAVVSPPAMLGGGWPLFVVALGLIAGITVFIKDFAVFFGCCADLKDSITAITVVALGTSLPDMFASMTSAGKDETADASIVNVTGSNAVNVFMGIGVPWTLASVCWARRGRTAEWTNLYGNLDSLREVPIDTAVFVVNAPHMGTSVMVYMALSLLAVILLHWRRLTQGGELGGDVLAKSLSAVFMISLWLTYIGFSVLGKDGQMAAMVLLVACSVVVLCFGVWCCHFSKPDGDAKPRELIQVTVVSNDQTFCKQPPSSDGTGSLTSEAIADGHSSGARLSPRTSAVHRRASSLQKLGIPHAQDVPEAAEASQSAKPSSSSQESRLSNASAAYVKRYMSQEDSCIPQNLDGEHVGPSPSLPRDSNSGSCDLVDASQPEASVEEVPADSEGTGDRHWPDDSVAPRATYDIPCVKNKKKKQQRRTREQLLHSAAPVDEAKQEPTVDLDRKSHKPGKKTQKKKVTRSTHKAEDNAGHEVGDKGLHGGQSDDAIASGKAEGKANAADVEDVDFCGDEPAAEPAPEGGGTPRASRIGNPAFDRA